MVSITSRELISVVMVVMEIIVAKVAGGGGEYFCSTILGGGFIVCPTCFGGAIFGEVVTVERMDVVVSSEA